MHEHKNIDETVANKNEQNQRQCLVSTWYYKARGWIAFTANIKMTETEWIQFNDIDDDGRICVYYIYDYISIYVHLNESMALCFVFCWLIKIGVRPWATKYHISCISVLARIFWNGQKYLQLQLLFGWRFMFIQCIESKKNLHNLCLFARFHCAYIFRFIFFAILFFLYAQYVDENPLSITLNDSWSTQKIERTETVSVHIKCAGFPDANIFDAASMFSVDTAQKKHSPNWHNLPYR